MSSTNPILDVRNLTREFGALRAVDEVSLQLALGERRAIIGPNGAGKTTLFDLISGKLPATSGEILLAGESITSLAPHKRAHRGLARTFQTSTLFPALTVRENLELGALGRSGSRFSPDPRRRTEPSRNRNVDRVLGNIELRDHGSVPVHELDHGAKRRLEVGLALVGEPDVLLMDEPAAGLGTEERHRMSELIQSLSREITLLIIEHDLDLVLKLVDDVTCLHAGSVLAQAPPEEIRRDERVREVYLGSEESNVAPEAT